MSSGLHLTGCLLSVAAVLELAKPAALSPGDLTASRISMGGNETHMDTTVRWPDGVDTHHNHDLLATTVPELRPATSPGPHDGPSSLSEAR